jgi:hypothetical protein
MSGFLLGLFLLAQGAIAPAGGVITGRLLNADGSPAAKVRVSVMPVQDVLGLSNLSETDAAGNFRIQDVAPGRYYIVAGFLEIPTFYPGTRDVSAATIVSVTSGATVAGVDFRVAPVSGGLTVAGRVVGLEALGTSVRLPVTVNLRGRNLVTATVNPDGTFEVPKVPPGQYTVSVSARIPNGGSTSANVVVVDNDIRGVEIRVYRLKTITGRIQLDGRGAIPKILAKLADSQIFLGIEPAIPNAREGSFRISVPEGESAMELPGRLPPGYAIKSFTYGNTDLMRNPLKVTAAENAEIRLVLSTSDRPGVKVSGRVAGVEKAAVPYHVSLQPIAYPHAMTALADDDGSFEFPEVFPGPYVFAIPELSNLSFASTDFTVGDTDVRNIEIKIPERKEIRGRLSVESREGRAPLPRLSMTWGSAPSQYRKGTPIEPQPDGTFKIALFEGEHTNTRLDLPQGYTLTSMMYGTNDLTNGRLRVSHADDAELRIVLTAENLRPVKVSGRAVGGETVSLKSSSYAAALNARVAADGRFEFPAVLPGNYALLLNGACAPVVVGDWDLQNVTIAAPPRGTSAPDVVILSAIFGSDTGAADVTPIVRQWMKPGTGDLYAAPRWLEVDPAVSEGKSLVISYLYQCEEYRLTVAEPGPVSYKILVEHADPRLRPFPAESAAPELKVLEAHYGSGTQFRVVTPRVRELVATGDPVQIEDATLNVTLNAGSGKQLIVSYTYRGIPATFITRSGQELSSAQLVNHAQVEMLGARASGAPSWLEDAEPFAPREPGDPGPGFGTAVRRELAIAYLMKALEELKALAPADVSRNVVNIRALIQQAVADTQTGMNYRYPSATGAPIVSPVRAGVKADLMGKASRALKTALSQLANANPNQDQTFLDRASGGVREAIAGLEGRAVEAPVVKDASSMAKAVKELIAVTRQDSSFVSARVHTGLWDLFAQMEQAADAVLGGGAQGTLADGLTRAITLAGQISTRGNESQVSRDKALALQEKLREIANR